MKWNTQGGGEGINQKIVIKHTVSIENFTLEHPVFYSLVQVQEAELGAKSKMSFTKVAAIEGHQ